MKPPQPAPVRFGPARSAGPFRIRRIDYAPGERQPPHSHPLTGLTIILSGAIRESTGAAEETGESLSVVVKPAGVLHSDEVGARGARTLQVVIDPEAAGPAADGRLGRWRWLHGARAAAPLVALARLVAADGTSSPELEEAVLEAVGTLDGIGRPSPDPPAWLVRVREALDDQLEAGVTVQALAREVGAHPVSVSRAFRQHYGRTISEYRRRERVRRAAARIAASSSSISRIAFATGHADHPHLCREFRRVAGVTPSEFRRLLC